MLLPAVLESRPYLDATNDERLLLANDFAPQKLRIIIQCSISLYTSWEECGLQCPAPSSTYVAG